MNFDLRYGHLKKLGREIEMVEGGGRHIKTLFCHGTYESAIRSSKFAKMADLDFRISRFDLENIDGSPSKHDLKLDLARSNFQNL